MSQGPLPLAPDRADSVLVDKSDRKLYLYESRPDPT